MIGLLEVEGKSKFLYLQNKEERGFIAVKESSKENPLPDGLYVVKLIEYREGKFGTFPYVSLIKALRGEVEEMAVALSETSLDTQREVLPLLWKVGFTEREVSRIENLLNCIAIADKKELLVEKEPKEDQLLQELGISIDQVRRAYHEILRAKQGRKGQDFQGGLSKLGEVLKRQKRKKAKQDSAKKSSAKGGMEDAKGLF